MLKKSQSMVCFPNSLFCEDFDMMLCPNLMTMHIKGRYHALTQGIKTLTIFNDYKKSYW